MNMKYVFFGIAIMLFAGLVIADTIKKPITITVAKPESLAMVSDEDIYNKGAEVMDKNLFNAQVRQIKIDIDTLYFEAVKTKDLNRLKKFQTCYNSVTTTTTTTTST